MSASLYKAAIGIWRFDGDTRLARNPVSQR